MAPTKPRGRTPKSQSDQIRDAQSPAPAPDRKDDGRPTNNLQAVREAESLGLINLLSQLRPLIAAVDEASAVVKTKREAVNKRLDQGVADGYPKGIVRQLLALTAVTGSRKDLREEWEMTVRFREAVGLPAMTQTDLEALTPEAAKDESDWIGAGYAAGVRGDSCDPKAAQVPPRLHQKWMEAWGEGQAKLVLSHGGQVRPKPDFDVIDGGLSAGDTDTPEVDEATPPTADPDLTAGEPTDGGEPV